MNVEYLIGFWLYFAFGVLFHRGKEKVVYGAILIMVLILVVLLAANPERALTMDWGPDFGFWLFEGVGLVLGYISSWYIDWIRKTYNRGV